MVLMNIRRCLVIFMLMIVFSVPHVFAEKEKLSVLDQEPVVVDFDDVVKDDGDQLKALNETALKIAVAAMISPKYTYQYYVELLNLIGEKMGREVVFVQKKTYADINAMLKKRELDVAFVCSGPYVAEKEDVGMEILAVPLCHGEKVYYSYFIASKDSGIESFKDLKGRTFAFTDPLSNTGCMVPTYYLAQKNETPGSFFQKTFFTYSHDNSIQAVAKGLADGAAVDSIIYEFIHSKSPQLTENIVIIGKSPPYGIPPVVVPSDMATRTERKVKNGFSYHP